MRQSMILKSYVSSRWISSATALSALPPRRTASVANSRRSMFSIRLYSEAGSSPALGTSTQMFGSLLALMTSIRLKLCIWMIIPRQYLAVPICPVKCPTHSQKFQIGHIVLRQLIPRPISLGILSTTPEGSLDRPRRFAKMNQEKQKTKLRQLYIEQRLPLLVVQQKLATLE
ncbi:hypothetical protein F4680DRAFT_424767 [Xylaria scruposa]|nr:hypothetical protein F4680DRAFT_424767 [Xylaria scruposa]